jgi:hypothetical protein
MISSLMGHAGVMVTGGSSNPYINMSNPSAGMVRYNGSNMEVYDGNSWLSIGSHQTVQLDARTQQILEWAEKRMMEETSLRLRMERHPGLKDAYEKFKIMDVLTQEEDNDYGEVQASP